MADPVYLVHIEYKILSKHVVSIISMFKIYDIIYIFFLLYSIILLLKSIWYENRYVYLFVPNGAPKILMSSKAEISRQATYDNDIKLL